MPQTVIVAEPVAQCTYNCYATAPVASSSGCGADSGAQVDDEGCSSSSAPASEPEAESSSAAASDSSSGCEGDSSDGSDHGCAGDSSADNHSSCSVPQTYAHPRQRKLPSAFAGTGLPLLIACLFQIARARRYRSWPCPCP